LGGGLALKLSLSTPITLSVRLSAFPSASYELLAGKQKKRRKTKIGLVVSKGRSNQCGSTGQRLKYVKKTFDMTLPYLAQVFCFRLADHAWPPTSGTAQCIVSTGRTGPHTGRQKTCNFFACSQWCCRTQNKGE